MPLPASLSQRLTLPLIAAPMLRVSGPDLVAQACLHGVIGSFPTANARGAEDLDRWLTHIAEVCARADAPAAPVCPNIIMRRERAMLASDVAVMVKHRVEMVIASVGSPEAIIAPLHDIGCTVFADVASLRHAEKALAVGADGLVLLSAGAGGQTGWINGMAFVRAVRAMFDGPIVLSGGMLDGWALWAAEVLGADLAMMGTRFIATRESLAADAYKAMLVDSRIDDVLLTRAFTGLDTNMLRPSVIAAGLDPAALTPLDETEARRVFSAASEVVEGPRRWVDIWSAGHSVSGVERVLSVADLIEQIKREYEHARGETRARLRRL